MTRSWISPLGHTKPLVLPQGNQLPHTEGLQEPIRLTQANPRRTEHQPLTASPVWARGVLVYGAVVNKTLSEVHCAWFGLQNTTPVANYAEICHLDFECSQGGWGTVFEGCATCKELISTFGDVSISKRCFFKNTVLKEAGL